MKKILLALAFVASASMAMAAFTPITNITFNTEYLITSLTTAGENTVPSSNLAFGTSSGGPSAGSIANMDNLQLNDGTTGNGTEYRTVLFGGVNYIDSNGSLLPDFFLFEGAGSPSGNPDDVSIAAIFPDDSLGQAVAAPTTINATGWGNCGGYLLNGGFQNGQVIGGVAWDITDLKDAGGVSLTSTAVIKGIRITPGSSLDPLAFLVFVQPYPFDHFAVTTSVASANVGDVFDVTITAQDIGNATVNNSSITITVAASGSLMEFDWNSDGTYGDNSGTLVAGVKTIKARDKRAETTAAIVASAGPATTPTPPSVTTTELAFSKLQVLVPGETAAPGTATGKTGFVLSHLQGTPFNVTVNAVDAYWNLIAAAPGNTIAITSSDNTATLPADAALAAGTQTFSITFNQTGSFTVTATNTTDVLIANGVSSPIASSKDLVWQGDGSVNLWNTSALNWTNLAGAPSIYANGDPVAFDDTGSSTPAVNIVGIVTPMAITVNSANNYIFRSTNSGGIAGPASLTKFGAGTLTLNTSNSYTGGTIVGEGGLLVLSNANALPNSGPFIMTNNMLVLAATNITRGSGQLQGTNAGFAAVGANRSVNVGNLTWGNANFFSDSPTTAILVLGRATDSFTLDFQSQIDFGNPGGNRNIQVDNGAAAVDVVISGRIQDASGSPGNLIKTGAGTLQLAHPTSNYEGTTEVQDGTVILTGGFNSDNAFILGNGTTSGVFQLGDASTIKNLQVGSLTTSGSGTANRVVGGNASVSTLTVNTVLGDVTYDGVIGGPGANQNNLALTKSGPGLTLTLTASNTYSGVTIVNNGTLALSGAGSINNSPSIEVTSPDFFDVSAVTGGYVLGAAQTLKGLGTVNGNVTANGRITPGSTGIGTLSFNNNLTLSASATLVMEINATNVPNCDTIVVSGTFTPGGTLTVTNIGTTGALALNDTFQLFSTAVSGFSLTQLPPTPSGLTWTNKVAVDGSIVLVAAPAPTPTNITFSVSGGNLILNWPAGQGWQLQSQTNPLTVGISTNWVIVPGAVPPRTNAVNPANGTVFYRLVWP